MQELAIVPYAASARAEAYNEAYAFAYPSTVAKVTKDDMPSVPEVLLRADNLLLRLSAFKRAEDRDHAVARFFYPGTEPACVTLTTSFRNGALVNLAEEHISPIAIENGTFTLEVRPKQIVSVELW